MHFWIAVLLIAGLWGELPIVVSPLPAGWTPPSREPYEFSGVAADTSIGFLQILRLDLKTKFCAQEWPKEGPSHPQTFPNGGQD